MRRSTRPASAKASAVCARPSTWSWRSLGEGGELGLGLGEPVSHLHRQIEVDGDVQRRAGVMGTAGAAVQLAEAEMGVCLERAHPELIGDVEGVAEEPLGARRIERLDLERDLAAPVQRFAFKAALLVCP